jgi:hypothetical protein
MSKIAYRVVGYALWRGGRWYLRQRMPPARTLMLRGLVAGGALTAMALAARRVKG